MTYKRGPRTLGSEGVGLRSPRKKYHGPITPDPDIFPRKPTINNSFFKTVEQHKVDEAVKLVWKDILQEDEENFTDEFKNQVIMTVKKIMEVE